jgi:RNA polymerase subunit RPABC4/transcription elongation factor Spt4
MPTDLAGQLGSVVNGFFSSAIVQLLLYSFTLYLFIVWLAASFWAFRDMHDRTENPVMPYLAATMIILTTPFFFYLGVIVYRVIRPAERLGEVYERNLAEEALLAEVEAVKTCRGCDRRVNEEWIICPWCRTRLNRVCPNCERLVGLDWTLCAWCGKDFERAVAAQRATVPEGPLVAPIPEVSGQSLPARAASGTITNRKPAIGG